MCGGCCFFIVSFKSKTSRRPSVHLPTVVFKCTFYLSLFLTEAVDSVEYKYMKIQFKHNRRAMGGTPRPKVKIGASRQIVIPKKLYDALGLSSGDYLEVGLHPGNRLLITPKAFVDADDVLTVSQRKRIDAHLAAAEADFRAGRVSGPFKSAEELVRHLHATRKK